MVSCLAEQEVLLGHRKECVHAEGEEGACAGLAGGVKDGCGDGVSAGSVNVL
jgi:hypothetical protein